MSEYVFKTDSPIKTCSECDYRCGLNIIARQNPEGRHEHCPLVELPPHGDLIERQEVKKSLAAIFRAYLPGNEDMKAYKIINETPTILEASEE